MQVCVCLCVCGGVTGVESALVVPRGRVIERLMMPHLLLMDVSD